MAGNIPKIREFPADDRYWRVDWFGAIERNPHVTSEPFVQIVISPFIQNKDIHSSSKKLASTHVTDYKDQCVIKIGVGQLPLISVGSIWLNGYCQTIKAGKQERFYNLLINDKTIRMVSGNHKEEDKNLIPYDGYRTGKGFMANLIAVERDNDPFGLLIPAMELIRFYYAVSTDMAHVIFSGDLKHQPRNILNPEKCGFLEEEDRCILHLRQHLSDEDGWVIGRILACDEAWQGATLPHDAMMRDSLNTKFSHPESGFPFSGFTNLKVRGKYIKAQDSNSKSGWRYLVLGIEHCSAPFPFENLTAGRDNDPTQSEGEDEISDADKATAFPAARHKTSDGKKSFQNTDEPDQAKTKEHIPLPTDRFGAIAGKKVDRPEKDQCRYISRLRNVPKEDESKNLGTGQGNLDGSEIARGHVDQTRTRRKALPASFETFKEAIELLNQTEGVQASLRPEEEVIEYIPLTKPANKKQWSYLDSSTRTRRHVIIADIYFHHRWYSLMEFELRKSDKCKVALISNSNGEYYSNHQINYLLIQLANEKGIWKNCSIFTEKAINIITMKHTWPSEAQFCKAINLKINYKSIS
ncbi:hypothetical protein Q4489_06045 [Thalassotalea sp. 1_MG-2023]|uniref:hypothetical protein n=1 Tax=Thalassotalea sp. 1_MG-2023 TaxID=3062680 RepID=UPI0026E34B16|nr:hypothetical protein [Thalassotalea sp. 1_MG-2023]MDO6426566.1 hypothetical protein [Thalassotalea sp. 1_MG-2023]